MDHEMQHAENATRHLLRLKYLSKIIKDKKAFDRHLLKLEKMQKMRMRMK